MRLWYSIRDFEICPSLAAAAADCATWCDVGLQYTLDTEIRRRTHRQTTTHTHRRTDCQWNGVLHVYTDILLHDTNRHDVTSSHHVTS